MKKEDIFTKLILSLDYAVSRKFFDDLKQLAKPLQIVDWLRIFEIWRWRASALCRAYNYQKGITSRSQEELVYKQNTAINYNFMEYDFMTLLREQMSEADISEVFLYAETMLKEQNRFCSELVVVKELLLWFKESDSVEGKSFMALRKAIDEYLELWKGKFELI